MCNPGVSPMRTDAQIAQEARHYLKGLLACANELSKRGYVVSMRAASEYAVAWPETLDFKKEVSL